MTFSPIPNVWTTFWLPIISSISPVCSPRISDCCRNMVNVLFAIKFATKKDTGVIRTTTNVIFTLTDSINPNVPMIVAIPVKSCVNPMSSPSAN